MKYKDVFGKALLDYLHNHYRISNNQKTLADILTWTNISDVDTLPLSYLFRSYNEMPSLEKKALELCFGTILDVGCGAGSHSLYMQNKGFKVKGIDISKGAVLTSQKRGVKNVEQINILEIKGTFDTILLLMNGTGIFQTYDNVQLYLKHLKSLLTSCGQILIDSSDIKYMFDRDFDVNNFNDNYYGEIDYYISYKGEEEARMKWLYLDYESLNKNCSDAGLNCEKIMEGNHFDYLARITHKK